MNKLIILLTLFFITISAFSKKDVIISIGGQKFTKSEYEYIYQKNNTQLNDESDLKTPEEYLDLFIDYKLKVIEAENRGYDTIKSFIDELAGYREELARPYLTEVTVTDEMVREVYFRTLNEIKASHILLDVPENATPEDTARIYNQLIDIRNQFLNGEKTFEELALAYSNDPSVKTNNGELGYFKAFSMLTAFENAAYATKVGDVSMPVKTRYGYHLIHVTDMVTVDEERKMAHIMKMFPDRYNIPDELDQKYKAEMDSVYNLIVNGADFSEMALKHSMDRSTRGKGGKIDWISKTFRVKEFADAAFAIEKDGEVIPPIRTPFGWHIVKRIETRKPLSFKEQKSKLMIKVVNDAQRSQHSKEKYLTKKRKELNYIAHTENIEQFKAFIKEQGDTIKLPLPEEITSIELYNVGDSIFTANSFLLTLNKKNPKSEFKTKILERHFAKYADLVIDEYESSKLELNHPEFAQIMEEYHDGMLLFTVMQEEVWDKAVTDSLGLINFYNNNKEKHPWEKHFSGLLIKCMNQFALDTCKLLISQGVTQADSLQKLINTPNKPIVINILEGKWEVGDNEKLIISFLTEPNQKN